MSDGFGLIMRWLEGQTHRVKRLKNFVVTEARRSGGWRSAAATAVRIFRREGGLIGFVRALKRAVKRREDMGKGTVSKLHLYLTEYAREEAALQGYVPLLEGAPPENTPVKLICFYLPQFHAIPENDVWWGQGFTEWTNVRPAKPQFDGHYQPHVPIDLGYYDLLDAQAQHRQVELAKLYGIGGFCFYFYWFGGKRLLDAPIENYLADESLDLPFCLCWANENWSRRWDGRDSEVLIAQAHSVKDDLAFIEHVAKYMRNDRYIRINGKPLLLVYRPNLLPDAKATALRWRGWCRENGLGEIYLAYTQSFESVDPARYGFDAAVEFPPNNWSPLALTSRVTSADAQFAGMVYDWRSLVALSEDYQQPRYKLFHGVCPSWDNTARRKNKGTVFVNSSPGLYRRWLRNAIDDTCEHSESNERLVFVNAWNEWAEGAHLEPDAKHGYAWLQATRDALMEQKGSIGRRLILVTHDAYPHGAQMLALNLVRVLSTQFHIRVDLICLGDGPLKADYARWAVVHDLSAESPQGEKARGLAARLYRQGLRKALVNTTASGEFLETLTKVGFECIALIHELGGVLKQMRLEESALRIATYAAKVVFPAQEVAASFKAIAPLADGREVIRPQGLYKRRPAQRARQRDRVDLRARLGVADEAFIVLGMGYADYRKGIDLFVEAGMMAARSGQALHWVWVGHWEDKMRKHVEHLLAAEPELRACFHFPGRQQDTDMFYGGADVFALTSREDPFPSVVLEALDAGLPVVGFEGAGGCADLLVQGDCGRLVPAENSARFAETVVELVHERDLTRRLGERGRVLIESQFSFRHYVFDLLDLLGMGFKRISAIVPNYNYAHYLKQRLSSILEQSYPIFEIIFLDDNSSDGSIESARAILDEQPIDHRIVVNESNSGSVFRQWQRGVTLARGELVWIGEADDSCAPSMLTEVVHGFDTPGVVLSYCESQQMDAQGGILDASYRSYVEDISHTRWLSAYVRDGRSEMAEALSIKNTIPNVSAVVFDAACLRAVLDAHMADIASFKVAGDWLVYVLMLEHGKIAFSPSALNQHRRHGKSVTLGSFDQSQLDEIRRMQQFVACRVDLPQEKRSAAERYAVVLEKQFGLLKED